MSSIYPISSRNCVYRFRCMPNGKRYIGATSGEAAMRRCHHESALRHGDHHSADFQTDWTRYGEGAFEFEIPEQMLDDEELPRRELFYIRRYGSDHPALGYNQMVGDRWSREARVRDHERKLIRSGKFHLLPGVKLSDRIPPAYCAAMSTP